jgi:hypothetical protein
VEDDADLAGLVEVQAVPDHDVEQVVRRERAIKRRFQMIGGDEALLAAARRDEHRPLLVVAAVGQELQREKRVGRAAFAQVDLDRIRGPDAVRRAHHHKVHGEAPEHALAREPRAELARLATDQRRIGRVGREAAAEVELAGRPAEQLVVRRQQLHVAERRDAQLHARAADLLADDALLDDPAALLELGGVALQGDVRCLEAHLLHARGERAGLTGRARGRQALEVDHRVALARDRLVQLDHRLADARPRLAQAGQRLDHRLDRPQVLAADRVGHADLGEQAPAAGLGAEREEPGVGAEERNAQSQREVALQERHVVSDHVRPVGV